MTPKAEDGPAHLFYNTIIVMTTLVRGEKPESEVKQMANRLFTRILRGKSLLGSDKTPPSSLKYTFKGGRGGY
jgi:hypothetical protein